MDDETENQIDLNKVQSLIQGLPMQEHITGINISSYSVEIRYSTKVTQGTTAANQQ